MNSFSFFNEYKGAILTQSVLITFALKKWTNKGKSVYRDQFGTNAIFLLIIQNLV